MSELYIYIIIKKCTSTSNFQETLCQKMYPLFLPVATGVSFKLRFFYVRSWYLCFYPHLSRGRVSKVHYIMDTCLHKIFCNVCKSFASKDKKNKLKHELIYFFVHFDKVFSSCNNFSPKLGEKGISMTSSLIHKKYIVFSRPGQSQGLLYKHIN